MSNSKLLVCKVKVLDAGKWCIVLQNKAVRFDIESTFENCFEKLNESSNITNITNKSVSIRDNNTNNHIDIEMSENIVSALELMPGLKYLSFKIEREKDPPPETETVRERTITDALMQRTRKLKPPEPKDNKCKLHIKILSDIQDTGNGLLTVGCSEQEGSKLFQNLVNTVWYLDGRSAHVNDTAKNRADVTPIPER